MRIDHNAQPDSSLPTGRRVSRWTIAALVAAWLVVLFLRHDWWNWHTPHPLLFGVIPVGLWWQAVVSILASVTVALMVRYAWPGHLERQAEEEEERRAKSEERQAGEGGGRGR